jgi:hypothetical protein
VGAAFVVGCQFGRTALLSAALVDRAIDFPALQLETQLLLLFQ